jgi:hypothetical protein
MSIYAENREKTSPFRFIQHKPDITSKKRRKVFNFQTITITGENLPLNMQK